MTLTALFFHSYNSKVIFSKFQIQEIELTIYIIVLNTNTVIDSLLSIFSVDGIKFIKTKSKSYANLFKLDPFN